MWTPVLVIYGAGLFATAVILLSARAFKHDMLMNVGSIILWPAYWALYLVSVVQDRRRR
jgi:hypothetical protein